MCGSNNGTIERSSWRFLQINLEWLDIVKIMFMLPTPSIEMVEIQEVQILKLYCIKARHSCVCQTFYRYNLPREGIHYKCFDMNLGLVRNNMSSMYIYIRGAQRFEQMMLKSIHHCYCKSQSAQEFQNTKDCPNLDFWCKRHDIVF